MRFKKRFYRAQADARDCGVAALAMILRTYGSEQSLASLRLAAGTTMEGTTALGIKKAAEQYQFEVQAVKADPSLFEMAAIPFPFIAHVIKDGKYPHYYVIYGQKKDRLLIADPDPNDSLRQMALADFFAEWTGLSLFIAPKIGYKPTKDKPSSLLHFVPILLRQKQLIANIIIASFLTTIINIIGSYYLQNIIDDYLPNRLLNNLNIISLGLMATYILQQVLTYSQTFLLSVLGQRLAIDVILSYIRHVLTLPMSFFATRRIGEITSRFSDANTILDAIASTILSVFLDVAIVMMTGIMLGMQNLQLFWLVLASIPLYILIMVGFAPLFEKQNKANMQANAMVNAAIIEDFKGIETIKALASEESRYEKIDLAFTDYLKKTFAKQKAESLQTALKTALQLLLGVGVLWLGAHFVLNEQMTLGQLITFNTLLTYFTNPLTTIINLQGKLQSAKVANERLNEVYLVPGEFTDSQADISLTQFDLSIQQITYQYGFAKPILQDVSLDIQSGEKITLVGMSGSGKSTLVKMLVNFFEPNQGVIKLGGVDVKEIPKRQLRRTVNYLPQQPYIFTGTVYENLTLGMDDTEISEDKLDWAVTIAEIKQDILNLQMGYQTQLSSDATTLSGGQQQRIALARAILSDAKILILDEATSNLDVLTEKRIIQNLMALDKTIIFIAHRLAIAEKSQRIVVIDQGKIIESGSHLELYAQGGFYATLYNS